MSDTARSILQSVYEKLKVYAPGVAINAADASTGLTEMNLMLDGWSTNSLACYANLEQSFPLVVAKSQYTIGSGGDINATRPLDINQGPGAAYLMDSNNNRYAIDVVDQDKWNQIPLLTIQSDLPNTMFYDPQNPLGVINIFPVPSAVSTVYFDTPLQLTRMPTLDTAFSLPVGYMEAIRDNMVIRLWSDYKQGDPTNTLMKAAETSLANIKRVNIKQSPAIYDSTIVSKAQSSYNVYDDTSGRNVS
jgi:hypothetical protein